MRRVGIYSPTLGRGGSEEHLIALARSLQSRGMEVFVSLPDLDGVRSVREDLAASDIAIDSFRASFDLEFSDTAFLRTRSHVLRQLEARAPDGLFLILPAIHTGAALIDAAAHYGVPTAVLFQLVGYVHYFSRLERQIYTWARRQRQAWAAVSASNRELLCESLGWGLDGIDVVPNGARPLPAIDALAVPATRQDVRREIGVPDDAILILTVARLDPQKAHDVTLRAAARLVARHPHAHFVWLGAGPLAEQLRSDIAARGLDGHVHMLGQRRDVSRFLAGCDLFLLPSRYEGMPLTLLEALHAGVPGVYSDIAPHREVIRDAQEGLLVAVDDHAALAKALEHLIVTPGRRASMGAAARVRSAMFSWDASFQRGLDLLARAGEHPARPAWPLKDGPVRRRIAIYGTGAGARRAFAETMPDEEVVAFLDRQERPSGESLYDRPILPPSAALTLDIDAVLVASCHFGAITETLTAAGYPAERIDVFDQLRLLGADVADVPESWIR
jgi:glycosyltransferase involved in cell wall biosynthesis